MKLLVKNNIDEMLFEDCFMIEIMTDNCLYTIFNNHKNIVLNLIQAKIEIVDQEKNKIVIFTAVEGILFFKNNIFEILIYSGI